MEKQRDSFDYEALKQKTLEQFRSGKSLFGKDGAFAPFWRKVKNKRFSAGVHPMLGFAQRPLT